MLFPEKANVRRLTVSMKIIDIKFPLSYIYPQEV